MKHLIDRAKYVAGGEEGASNIEIVVWITVVLVIAVALFAFRDKISSFINSSSDTVGNMDTKIKQTNGKI